MHTRILYSIKFPRLENCWRVGAVNLIRGKEASLPIRGERDALVRTYADKLECGPVNDSAGNCFENLCEPEKCKS